MKFRAGVLALSLSLVAACASDPMTPTPAPLRASIASIAVTPRALVVDGAGDAAATVQIVRAVDDEGGPVPVEVIDLPDGASFDALTIPAGSSQATLTIHAGAAARALSPVTVRGEPAGTQARVAHAVLATGGITSGVLDPSFGVGGETRDYAIPRWARQPGGSLVVVGGASILRLGADGTPTGFSTTAVPISGLRALHDQPDGSLLVAGFDRTSHGAQIDFQGQVWRVLPSGELDPDFGTAGVAAPADTRQVLDVAVQPDGKLVLLGLSQNGAIFVGRLMANGAVDDSFGFVTSQIGDEQLQINATTPTAGGGWLIAAGDHGDGILARLLPSGGLDPGFGSGGVRRPFNANYLDVTTSGADGSVIALRTATDPVDYDRGIDTFVEWYDAGGNLATTWQYAAGDDAAQGWTFDAEGRPLVAIAGSAEAIVIRLAGGDVDASFGDGDVMAVSDYLDEAAPIDAITTDGAGRILLTNAGVTMRVLP